MRSFLLFFLLALPLGHVYGQDSLLVADEDDSAAFTPHNFMEIYYGPASVSHAVYTPDGVFMSKNQRRLSAFTVGAGFHRQETKHFSYRIDAEVSFMALAEKRLATGTSVGNGVTIDSTDYQGNYGNANLSLMAGWSLYAGKKLAIGFFGGCSPQLKLQEQVNYAWHYSNGNVHGDGNSYRKKMDTWNADVRAAFFIEAGGSKTKFFICPLYRYELFNTFRGISMKHASSFSLQLGWEF